MKKYELIKDEDSCLFRIKALKKIKLNTSSRKDIEPGDIGGLVQSEKNLSQEGSCWIFDDAKVTDNAQIKDDAIVSGWAEISDNAIVKDNSFVSEYAQVRENAVIRDNAIVRAYSAVKGNAIVENFAYVEGSPVIKDHASVGGCACIDDYAVISENATISNKANISGEALVFGNAKISGIVKNKSKVSGEVTVSDGAKILGESVLSGNLIIYKDNELKSVGLTSSSIFVKKDIYNIAIHPGDVPDDGFNVVVPIHYSSKFHNNSFISECRTKNKIGTIKVYGQNHYSPISNSFKSYEQLEECVKDEFLSVKSSKTTKNKPVNSLFSCLENTSVKDVAFQIGKNCFDTIVKYCPKNEKETLTRSKKNLSHILSIYIFSQFLGIFLYGIEMFLSDDPDLFFESTSEDYKNFLFDIINNVDMDLSSKTFSFQTTSFDYVEMLYAIKEVFKFSSSWEKDMLNALNTEKTVKLYAV